MATSRIHPHIEMPSDEELLPLVVGKSALIQQLYLDAHHLVLAAVPDIRFAVDCVDGEIGYGAQQFGYDGWGMAAVTPYANWVTLAFVRGATLVDPNGLLQGTARTTRHIKFKTHDELADARHALTSLLQEAAGLSQR